jgi:hypothetical protein
MRTARNGRIRDPLPRAARAVAQESEGIHASGLGGPRCHRLPTNSGGVAATECRLAEVAQGILARLVEIRRAEALTRFAIGDDVHSLRYGPAAGPQDVRRLAKLLGLDESGLRRIGRTAEGIRPAQRKVILSLTDDRGLPLTWSHLEALARIRRTDQQIRVARKALAEWFSVEDLKRYVGELETVSQSARGARRALDAARPAS